jgi:hypothetical protein
MLTYYSAMKYARALAEAEGFSLSISPKVKVHHTDGRTINTPPYPSNGDPVEENRWMAALIHEVYHHDHPADFNTLKDLHLQECLYTTGLNVVVDHNIERCRQGEYIGRDKRLRTYRDDTVGLINKNGNLSQIQDTEGAVLAAMTAWDNELRMGWQDNHVPMNLPDGSEAQTLLEKLRANQELCDRYVQPRKGGEPNKQLLDDIFSYLEIPPEEQTGGQGGTDPDSCEERGKQQQGEGKGKQGEGKGKGSGDGNSDEAQKRTQEAIQKWKEQLELHDHDQSMDPRANMKLSYDDYHATKDYVISPSKQVRQREPNVDPTRKSNIIEILHSASDLPKRVRNELKIASVVRREHGKKSGRLDRKKISKVATRSKSDRLFTRRGAPKDVLDTAAFLLVDCSGSMSGDKYSHAAAGAVMLHDCFDALKMPVAIGAFTNAGRDPLFYQFQGFDERVHDDELLDRMSSVRMSQNPDGEALIWASGQLLKRKEKRKLLVVLSDGSPAFMGDDAGFLKKVTKNIEEESPIDLVGIGIMDTNVKRFYTNHTVVEKANQLETTILDVIKRNLLK